MIVSLIASLSMQATAPPAVRATARQNLAGYVRDNDYPRQALSRRAMGIVYFELAISAEGRVSNCRVTRSSGEPSLDEQTCRIMLQRARFRPARDAAGQPVADVVTSRLGWFFQGVP